MPFLHDFRLIECPYGEVAARLEGAPAEVLSQGLDAARREGEYLRGRVGLTGWPAFVAKTVDLAVGDIRRVDLGILLAFSWEAVGGSSLFPRMDADLEVSPFGVIGTQVVLQARYQPPGGIVGRGADRVLHRVAESTIRAYLAGVCSALEGEPPPAPGDAPAARSDDPPGFPEPGEGATA